MPSINYVSQTAQSISVTFADMPAQTEIVFVNSTSGVQATSPSTALAAGGDGSADIPIDLELDPGQYYLLAQNQTTKEYCAQTVAFYLN